MGNFHREQFRGNRVVVCERIERFELLVTNLLMIQVLKNCN